MVSTCGRDLRGQYQGTYQFLAATWPLEALEFQTVIAYGIDMFIPLIKLRERHYKIELSARVRYYFYIHKLAGWVLGSFLAAAVSGVPK